MQCFKFDKLGNTFVAKLNEQFVIDQKQLLSEKILAIMQKDAQYFDMDSIKLRTHVKILVDKMDIRKPNLPDKFQIIQKWYNQSKNEDSLVTKQSLALFFVRLGLVKEVETATQLLEARLKNTNKYIEQLDFARCFMGTVFKEALIDKIH